MMMLQTQWAKDIELYGRNYRSLVGSKISGLGKVEGMEGTAAQGSIAATHTR